MKKRIYSFLMMLLMLLLTVVGGCSNSKEEGNVIFYLSSDGTSIESKKYELQGRELDEQVSELMDKLQSDPDDVDMVQTIPEDMAVTFTLDNVHVTLDFPGKYYELPAGEEVLMRAAIVKTLLQIKQFYYVNFTVNGEDLVDKSGNKVGNMGRSSFVENPGQQINSSTETNLTLYFSNADGTALVTEQRTVKHSASVSVEKLIMEQLIVGSKEKGHISTIPPATQIYSIAVSDGVCFVNFDDAIKNQNMEISENVVLYSIVNSLTQIPSVKEVMISINGDNSGELRYNKKLSVFYERDLTYLEGNEPDSEDTETTEEPDTNGTEIELPLEGVLEDQLTVNDNRTMY